MKKELELRNAWEETLKSWDYPKFAGKYVSSVKKADGTKKSKTKIPESKGVLVMRIPSMVTPGGQPTLPPTKVYTGTKVLGIATLHKSNMVPVFSKEEAIDISKMRRN